MNDTTQSQIGYTIRRTAPVAAGEPWVEGVNFTREPVPAPDKSVEAMEQKAAFHAARAERWRRAARFCFWFVMVNALVSLALALSR